MADVDSLLAKEGYFIKFRSLLGHFPILHLKKWLQKKPISERTPLDSDIMRVPLDGILLSLIPII
jgi:hypothetical protein